MATLTELSSKQRERLEFIEFLLRFKGSANRSDIGTRFGIQPSAATKDFKLYRELAESNLNLDQKTKNYVINCQSFKPKFDLDVKKALSRLRDPSIGKALGLSQIEATSTPPRLGLPNIEVLSAVTRAIATEKPIELEYYSPYNSGYSKRVISPHGLVDNGLRWHIRAYNRKREKFSDFVLNRCNNVVVLDEQIEDHERKNWDRQWNWTLELELAPHPNRENVKYPDAIALEYGMSEGSLKIPVRAAVAGYWLRLWNVDCSADHSLEGPEYQLYLVNPECLRGVETALWAPGNTDSQY